MAFKKTDALNATAKYATLENGGTELGVSRQAITWSDDSGDSVVSGTTSFTGGTANAAVDAVGFYSAATGGTYYGNAALSGDTTLNAEGKYDVTSLKVTG